MSESRSQFDLLVKALIDVNILIDDYKKNHVDNYTDKLWKPGLAERHYLDFLAEYRASLGDVIEIIEDKLEKSKQKKLLHALEILKTDIVLFKNVKVDEAKSKLDMQQIVPKEVKAEEEKCELAIQQITLYEKEHPMTDETKASTTANLNKL